jgi:hypothetical protein
MLKRKHRVIIAIPCLLLWLPLTSCSTGPQKPKQGTPAFYWDAAKETLAKRDYLKTTEHLRRVIRTENEFTQRAAPFRLAVASGLAQGYLDIATDLQKGVKASKLPPAALRKTMADYRLLAETRSLEFAETFILYVKSPKQENVLLDFPFPQVATGEIAERSQIQGGAVLSPEVMTAVERRMIERSVPEGVAASVGAPGDIAKARAAFQSGSAQVPREVFMQAMVDSLYQQMGMFSRAVLNKPDRLFVFANQGLEALKTMEANEHNKHSAEDFKAMVKIAQQLQP